MIGRVSGVQQVQSTAAVSGAGAYRTPYIPAVDTNGVIVQAASLDLLPVLATAVAQGRFSMPPRPRNPSPSSAPPPPGSSASTASTRASASGSAAGGSTSPASSGPPCSPPPSTRPSSSATPRREIPSLRRPPLHHLRPRRNDRVDAVDNLLAATANPENPSQVNVSQPSAALVAQADARSALNGLFLGLGAVALLVGAVGVANIMIISVLERRSEIGLRRALGATRGHIRSQFLSEAILLGLLGGAAGVALGAASTALYAHTERWATVIPTQAWAGGIAASLLSARSRA